MALLGVYGRLLNLSRNERAIKPIPICRAVNIISNSHGSRRAVAYSLSSAGHYLVFDSSDLSIERKELFCIYRLKRF